MACGEAMRTPSTSAFARFVCYPYLRLQWLSEQTVGHEWQLRNQENPGDLEMQWMYQYGNAYRIGGCFGVSICELTVLPCTNRFLARCIDVIWPEGLTVYVSYLRISIPKDCRRWTISEKLVRWRDDHCCRRLFSTILMSSLVLPIVRVKSTSANEKS